MAGCRVWSTAGPPPFSRSSLDASVRPPPPPPLPSAARGRSASFPTGSVISCAPGVVRDLFPGGGRDALALLEAPAAPPPPRLSGTDGAGVAPPRAGGGVCAGAAGGLARPAAPSGPRVSAPLLSGYLALAFRRGGLKTPGGSPYRPRGRGGGGARRDVGRPREGFPVPPHVRRSLRLSGAPLRPPALPEAAVRGGVSRAPSGRPRGSRPERLACPARWRAAAGCRVRGVPCPVCPAFPSPTLSFFFISYVCLVSFLAGRPEAEPPRRRAPPIPRRRGGRGRLLRSSAPRVSPLTPQITDTTLSGGSLGSCVDEERS